MRRPRVPLPSTLGRAAAELFIIVAGVLIALGAQSWWENRQLDEDRERAVGLLYDDLSRLEGSLRDSVAALEIDANIHRLLAGRPPESDSTLARVVGEVLWDFGFQIGARDGQNLLPSYADLKSSGRLSLLPDTVRERMPGIELQLVILSRFLEDVIYFQQNRVDPILLDRFRLDPELVGAEGTFQVADAEAYAGIFRDPGVRNRLLLKSVLLRNQMVLWRQTADSVQVVRRLLREES